MIAKKIFLVLSLLPSTGAWGRHHSLFSREALGMKNNNNPSPEINECSTNADCPTGSFCDTTGTNGNRCQDIDECATGTHDCDVNADCADTNGSFICTCKPGYTGDGKTCNEAACLSAPCKNGGACEDIVGGGYNCECTEYWEGDTCEADVNECEFGEGANNNCLLNHGGRLCRNLIGAPGYECCYGIPPVLNCEPK